MNFKKDWLENSFISNIIYRDDEKNDIKAGFIASGIIAGGVILSKLFGKKKKVTDTVILKGVIDEMNRDNLSKDDIELSASVVFELSEEYDNEMIQNNMETIINNCTEDEMSADSVKLSAQIIKNSAETLLTVAE